MPVNFVLRRLTFATIILIVVIMIVEAAGFGISLYLASKGVLYRPQSEVGFENYIVKRHPILGWSPQPHKGSDSVGSRPIPANPDPSSPCVSLYGDSFTWSSEVAAKDAWGNRLSLLLKCRVHNFGVPGYGSDQAYLRYSHNALDTAKVIVLVHLSENILRNTNRYAWLQYPGAAFSFKPRFLTGKNLKLTYLPPPQPSLQQFRKLIAEPEMHLKHDAFVPGGIAGVNHFDFPYTAGVINGFL